MIRWILVSVVAAMAAAAEPVKKEGVTVELVSERPSVTPGETGALAVVFRHEPGYHTYWRQPGIVGLATSMRWTLPPGFKAGEILWPAPERTKMAHWGVWGFERDVALVVPITVPRDVDLSTTRSATFAVQAIWMACGETCHPGSASLSITLPVSKEASPVGPAARFFAATRDEQAVERPEWKVTARVRRGTTGAEGFDLVVTAPPGRVVPKDAYFFSHARLVDSHAAQEHRVNRDGSSTIALRLVESPEALPRSFEGDLHSATGWDVEGRRHLLRVKVPLESDG